MGLCLGGVNIRNLSSGKLFSVALDSLCWSYHSASFKAWLLWIVYVFIFSLVKYGNMRIMSHPIYLKVSGLHAGQILSQGHFMLGLVLSLPEPWEDHSLISKVRLSVFFRKSTGRCMSWILLIVTEMESAIIFLGGPLCPKFQWVLFPVNRSQ